MENRRLGSQPKTGRSHYQFKNWTWEHGVRKSAVTIRPLKGEYADLINTCYANPAKRTETLYCLALDLDAHRADERWKTKAGVLQWPRIKKWLNENHPDILKYVFAVVRSTGGKGLALYIALAPLELVYTTKKAQFAAKTLQEKLLLLFNNNGLGADPSAIGLKRDFCNWLKPTKLVYDNVFVMRAVQANRTPVVRNLLAYLKPFGLANYIKKSEREGLLYPDLRAERKLSKLYMHLYNSWLDGDGTVQLSVAEIRRLTELSRPFVEKFLKNPPKWLLTEYLDRSEGWILSILVDRTLTRRSWDLSDGLVHLDLARQLSKPELVEDGQRNLWITQACLVLKHNGTAEHTALQLIKDHVSYIPGAERSTNCKNAAKILYSIYANHQDLFGVNPACAPAWLLNRSILVDTPSSLRRSETKEIKGSPRKDKQKKFKIKTRTQTTLEKGGYPPVFLRRKVSRDQCFVFGGNYYSLSKFFVAREVLVFPWEDKLRVYEDDGITHVHTHTIIVSRKGKYQTESKHFDSVGLLEEQYLESQIKYFASDGAAIGAFAKLLVSRYGLFAIRRLWQLRGLIKEFGSELLNESTQHAKNLGDLRKIIKLKN